TCCRVMAKPAASYQSARRSTTPQLPMSRLGSMQLTLGCAMSSARRAFTCAVASGMALAPGRNGSAFYTLRQRLQPRGRASTAPRRDGIMLADRAVLCLRHRPLEIPYGAQAEQI